jgi:superoxide reductase
MNEMLFYRCEKCGNIVVSIKSGGGTLTCCGGAMTEFKANSTDAAKEKHVPVVAIEAEKIKVTVGSVAHPMTPEHYIQWIALVTDNKVEIRHLKPGMEPKAQFTYYPGEDEILFTGTNDEIVPNCEGTPCNFAYSGKTAQKVAVYAYCNLHGLWETKL